MENANVDDRHGKIIRSAEKLYKASATVARFGHDVNVFEFLGSDLLEFYNNLHEPSDLEEAIGLTLADMLDDIEKDGRIHDWPIFHPYYMAVLFSSPDPIAALAVPVGTWLATGDCKQLVANLRVSESEKLSDINAFAVAFQILSSSDSLAEILYLERGGIYPDELEF